MKEEIRVGIKDKIVVTITDGSGRETSVESISGLPDIIKKYFLDNNKKENDNV